MYRNGTFIYTGLNTTNQYTDSDVTDVYLYSVTATSCAGGITSSVTSVSIGGEYYLLIEKLTSCVSVKLLNTRRQEI